MAVGAAGMLVGLAGPAAAQKIVCWKDKAGKTLGCGDKVPPEYQSSATKELDSRGVTRKQTESVEEANARRLREQEASRVKTDDDKKRLDQQRQDTALLETFSNEKEIDLKRDRDSGVIDGQLEQLTAALKPVTQRYNEAKARFDQTEKGKGGAPQGVKEEYQRAAAEKERLDKNIASKQHEKEELRKRYAEYKRRYTELKAGGGVTPTAAKK
jgi:hypothetical protein